VLTVPRTVRTGQAKSILLVWLALELFVQLGAKPAFAAEPLSSCPSREATSVAVRALLKPSHVDTAGIETQFEVQDFGDRYAVTVKGRRRDYHDEPRDCAKRAHVAAVFIALTLAPPDIPLPEQPEPAPPPRATAPSAASSSASQSSTSSPAPAPTSPPTARVPTATTTATATATTRTPPASAWSIQVELGALATAAPRSEAWQTALGAELRWSVLRDQWGLTLGAAVTTSSTLELEGVPVRESRIPFDLAIRRNLRAMNLQGSLELGLAAALTRLRQEDLAGAEAETRLELGARAAGRLALGSQLAPYLSVFTEFFPFPHELAAEPRGSIGHTSSVWLGASLGLMGKFP
jgi:hypothetical protein